MHETDFISDRLLNLEVAYALRPRIHRLVPSVFERAQHSCNSDRARRGLYVFWDPKLNPPVNKCDLSTGENGEFRPYNPESSTIRPRINGELLRRRGVAQIIKP